jgi:hypothetical protein
MSSCWLSYEHFLIFVTNDSQEIKLGMVYLYHKKLSHGYQNVMEKMVEQWTRKHKVVGSTPQMGKILVALFKKNFHSHIHKI